MDKTLGQSLYTLTESGGFEVGAASDHVVDESTVEMPPPNSLPRLLTLPQFIPVTLPAPPLPPIPDPRTPLSHRFSPGERPTTRSQSTSEKSDRHEIKWFEDHYGVKQKINGPYPFFQWFLRTTIGSRLQKKSICHSLTLVYRSFAPIYDIYSSYILVIVSILSCTYI